MRLSTRVMFASWSSNRRASVDPMNPRPPVMSTFRWRKKSWYGFTILHLRWPAWTQFGSRPWVLGLLWRHRQKRFYGIRRNSRDRVLRCDTTVAESGASKGIRTQTDYLANPPEIGGVSA